MLFNKEDIFASLQEKAFSKLEMIRHDLAQAMFDAISEEGYFVYDTKENDVVGGPFATQAKAKAYIADMEDADDLIVMSEKKLEKKLGIKG